MSENIYDTIVIGSGVSGMTTGLILSKEGEKVLILEQHHTPGGLMQTYKRKGSVFPTGVHRLGSLRKNQPLWYYFKYLGILDKLNLVPMDKDGFEQFIFPDETYTIPEGHDAYRMRLTDYFPREKGVINRYLSDLKQTVSSVRMYNPAVSPTEDKTLSYTGSIENYLSEIGASKKLKSVLLGNNYLYGLPPSECPIITHFLISDSYLNSSFRIDEAKTPFSDAFISRFKSLGGEIRTSSQVASVLTENREAKGIMLENGDTFFSKRVIFTGHPSSILDICPHELFRPVFRKRLRGVENTAGIFGLAIKWDRDTCPVSDRDVYIFNKRDHNIPYAKNSILRGGNPDIVFVSSLPETGTDSCSVTALTAVIGKDNSLLTTYRKESYKDKYLPLKNQISESVFKRLTETWPACTDHTEIVDIYTPATFERYTLTPNGTAYGVKKRAGHFLESMFNPATKIKNFYMAGQSIAFTGIHGSLVSSVILCSMLLGNEYLMEKIKKVT